VSEETVNHVDMFCAPSDPVAASADAEAVAFDEEAEEDVDIAFLSMEDVLDLHDEGMRRYTPLEPRGIKDRGLLESAVMAPQQTWGGDYLYSSLAEMAAVYLMGLAQNHAFEQGNKRVGLAACSQFLRRNGYQLTLTQDEAINLMLRVVNGEIDRDGVVEIIEDGVTFVV